MNPGYGMGTIKRSLCAFLVLLSLTACMQAIGNLTGTDFSRVANPVMELEMNLVFLDGISALTKMNQIVLERVPVSLSDPWPELLNHYFDEPKLREKPLKKQYDDGLTRSLKRDFHFFDYYNVELYLNLLTKKEGANILGCLALLARDTLVIEAAKEMGRGYEHAKSVVSYYPFGCSNRYYSARFESVAPESAACRRATVKKECTFFHRPTEEMLYEYLFSSKGLQSWVDLKISRECLRVVEGETLGTFKDVFYTLLPQDLVDKIKTLDEEIEGVELRLEEVRVGLSDKKLGAGQKEAYEKRKAALEKDVENKKELQKKLYQKASGTLEPTREKVLKAKKLLNVARFIDENFARISTAMTALTVKIVDDTLMLKNQSTSEIGAHLAVLAGAGVLKGVDIKRRTDLLVKRLVALPVNYASVWGHAVAQKYQVAQYKGYLEALVAMEFKVNR